MLTQKLSTAQALVIHGVLVSLALLFVGVQIRNASPAVSPTAPTEKQAAVGAVSPLLNRDTPAAAFDQSKLGTEFSSDFVYGSRDAKVTLISYLDYECPFCAKFLPVALQAVDDSGGQLNLVLRLYPLDFHPHADLLANAAVCVGDQAGSDGFYRFSSAIFAAGRIPDDAMGLVKKLAAPLKLDAAKFETCVKDRKLGDKVKASTAEAIAIGVAGTPSTVIYDSRSKKARFVAGIKKIDELKQEVAGL